MAWSVLSGLTAIGAIVLVPLEHPQVACILALAGVFLSPFGSRRVDAR